MTRYRIIEELDPKDCSKFVPQRKTFWWPFWSDIKTCIGIYDVLHPISVCASSRKKALEWIDLDKRGAL